MLWLLRITSTRPLHRRSEGLILEAKKRFSNNFTLFGNYTFSKGFDTSTDYNTDYGPQIRQLGLDRALRNLTKGTRLLSPEFDSPWKNPILAGFQLSPIFSYHSGHPFNLLAGTEVNGNNHTTTSVRSAPTATRVSVLVSLTSICA